MSSSLRIPSFYSRYYCNCQYRNFSYKKTPDYEYGSLDLDDDEEEQVQQEDDANDDNDENKPKKRDKPRRTSTRLILPQSGSSDNNNNTKGTPVLSDEWIPPSRPLLGDQGYSHLYRSENETDDELDDDDDDESQWLKTLEQEEADDDDDDFIDREQRELMDEYQRRKEQDLQAVQTLQSDVSTDDSDESAEATPDWLQTRRSMLGTSADPDKDDTIVDVSTSANAVVLDSLIPIVKHTLLNPDEIITILKAFGGTDIQTIRVMEGGPSMGAGVLGMILTTAPSHRHLHNLANQVVRALRDRHLQEVGVQSAKDGPHGNKNDPLEKWMLVDCGNWAVHVLMADTRKHLDLEGLWTGKDPIWDLDFNDEAAVDHYCTVVRPVPSGYGPPQSDYNDELRKLESNRYTAPHRPVVKQPKTSKRVPQFQRGGRRRSVR